MSELRQLCSFTVGSEDYALDIMRIKEIIQPQKITSVPKVPAFIEGVIELLFFSNGTASTEKGFKQLDEHIGCIYGDAISKERAVEITDRLAQRGFASSNIVFGVGSYTYQYNTRDTLMQAMKATWVEIGGEGKAIFKKPVTDDGVKNSATGRLAVFRNADGLYVIENANRHQEEMSLLRPVWKDGKFLVTETFDVVRARARLGK